MSFGLLWFIACPTECGQRKGQGKLWPLLLHTSQPVFKEGYLAVRPRPFGLSLPMLWSRPFSMMSHCMVCWWTSKNASTTCPVNRCGLLFRCWAFRLTPYGHGSLLWLVKPVASRFEPRLGAPLALSVDFRRVVLCRFLAWPLLTGCWTGGWPALKFKWTCGLLLMIGGSCSVSKMPLAGSGRQWKTSQAKRTWPLTWQRPVFGLPMLKHGRPFDRARFVLPWQLATWGPIRISADTLTTQSSRSAWRVCLRCGCAWKLVTALISTRSLHCTWWPGPRPCMASRWFTWVISVLALRKPSVQTVRVPIPTSTLHLPQSFRTLRLGLCSKPCWTFVSLGALIRLSRCWVFLLPVLTSCLPMGQRPFLWPVFSGLVGPLGVRV